MYTHTRTYTIIKCTRLSMGEINWYLRHVYIFNIYLLMCSNNDNDLEDGEIPSDEDDEPITANSTVETAKPTPKSDNAKNKNFDIKFNKNKKQSVQMIGKHDRFLKYKAPTEDWAGDVEKAIKAAMEEDGTRNQESKAKNKSNRNKAKKRIRDDREEDRSKDQKVCNFTNYMNLISISAIKCFYNFTTLYRNEN